MALKLQTDTKLSDDLRIIGISTALKDYRLCHFLNRDTVSGFERQPDFIYHEPSMTEESIHSIYYFYDDHLRTEYFLMPNRSGVKMLFPQQKKTDYFIFLKGSAGRSNIKALQKKVQQLPQVMLAFEIDPKELKNLDFFMHELELHSIGFRKKAT